MGSDAEEIRESYLVPAAVLLAIAIFAVYGIFTWPGPNPQPAGSETVRLFRPELLYLLKPKPWERGMYLVGLLCAAFLPLAIFVMLKKLSPAAGPSSWWARAPSLKLRDGALLLLGAAWIVILAKFSAISPIGVPLILGLGLSLLLPLCARLGPAGKPLYGHAIALLLMLGYSGLMLVGEGMLPVLNIRYHYDLLLGAVNQVMHGNTILVDTTSEYGIAYPYVAALYSRLFGFSYARLSLFFVILSFLSLVFFYLALCKKSGRGSLLTLVLFAGFLGLCHPVSAQNFFHANSNGAGPYYQYFPLRVIFGAFFIWFTGVYLQRRGAWLLATGYALAGFSALWNADTGVVILIAWTATAIFDEWSRCPASVAAFAKAAARQALFFILALTLNLMAYGLFAILRSGEAPQWREIMLYQSLLYGSGFLMLPMPLWELWQPVILLYVITLFYCFRRMRKDPADWNPAWYFFIAIYGLGIFSYYQGRSAITNLPPVAYPAGILACFFIMDAWRRLEAGGWKSVWTSAEQRHLYLKYLALATFILTGIVSLIASVPFTVRYGRSVAQSIPHSAESEEVARRLGRYIEGTSCMIFSNAANYFHIKTHSRSALPFSSINEAILASQMRSVCELLEHGNCRYVLVDKELWGATEYIPRDRYVMRDVIGPIAVFERRERGSF